MAFKKRTFKKRGTSSFKKFVMKKLQAAKPEKKQHDLVYTNLPIPTGQNSQLLLPISRGVNANQRIGDKIKATSYYAQFYIRSTSTNAETLRMIHFFNEDDSPVILNQSNTPLLINELPRDQGYIIKEDKLITFTPDGTEMKKVVIKGKFRYPHNIKWNNDILIGYHPRLVFISTSSNVVVNGTIRYFYTDA